MNEPIPTTLNLELTVTATPLSVILEFTREVGEPNFGTVLAVPPPVRIPDADIVVQETPVLVDDNNCRLTPAVLLLSNKAPVSLAFP